MSQYSLIKSRIKMSLKYCDHLLQLHYLFQNPAIIIGQTFMLIKRNCIRYIKRMLMLSYGLIFKQNINSENSRQQFLSVNNMVCNILERYLNNRFMRNTRVCTIDILCINVRAVRGIPFWKLSCNAPDTWID